MDPTFTVTGSYGSLTVSATDGRVLNYLPLEGEGPEYQDIVIFDVAEWRSTYPTERLEGLSVDILDLGYTLKDGSTYAPEVQWRADFRQCRG